jgi:hypothetical protein
LFVAETLYFELTTCNPNNFKIKISPAARKMAVTKYFRFEKMSTLIALIPKNQKLT